MDILRILLCHVIQKFALQYKMSYFKNIRQLFETIVRELRLFFPTYFMNDLVVDYIIF